MLLYPQLSRQAASELFDEVSVLAISDAACRAVTTHPRSSFAPTGGHQVSEAQLLSLQREVRAIALECGFPTLLSRTSVDIARQSRFDAATALYLFDHMQITPHAATQRGGWYFLACALLPDVVLWRWGRSHDRWLERGARVNRNCFGRLWWRVHVISDTDSTAHEERLAWLTLLSEDNWVQLLERPGFTGYRPLTMAILRACFPKQQYLLPVPQEAFVRNVLMRFSRLGPLIAFEALAPNQLQALAEDVVRQTLVALVESSAP